MLGNSPGGRRVAQRILSGVDPTVVGITATGGPFSAHKEAKKLTLFLPEAPLNMVIKLSR